MSQPPPPELDAFTESVIERAIVPYRALLSPEMLEVFRDELVLAMTEHPVAVELRKRLRPRAAVVASATVDVEGANAPTAADTKNKATGGSSR